MGETVKLKHINRVMAKNKVYYYHRKTGEKLPNEPNARALRVLAINASLEEKPVEAGHGTFACLIAEYQGSPEFKQRADLTKRDYRRHLSAIGKTWGKLQVEELQKRQVVKMRDNMADTPRVANYRMAVLSLLINFGIGLDERAYGKYNAVRKIKKLDEGPGYSPWPENVIKLFYEAAYPELRYVVISGALGTGQRGQDVVAMSWVHLHDGGMEVTQKKTGARLLLPITEELAEAINKIKKKNAIIFTTKSGLPWGLGHLRHEVARILEEIGHPGYTLHGLRFNAARRLYESGSTWEDIAAITGHRNMEMAKRYVTRAERASTAVERMRTKGQRRTAKPTAKLLTIGREKV